MQNPLNNFGKNGADAFPVANTSRISQVVVYCASSADIGQIYFDAAQELGRLLAENGMTCISGAGKQGLMGAINNAVLESGGKVKGIIPQFMVDYGWYHPDLTELIVTENMHERKQLMAQHSDAVVALPGGLGTLEELAEILTWRQLELYEKPIVILNVGGFYDPLIEMLDRMIEQNFMNEQYRNMWQVVQTPREAIEYLKKNDIWKPDFAKYDKKES